MTTATDTNPIATIIDGKLTLDPDLKDKIVANFMIVADAMGVTTDPQERAEWVREHVANQTPTLVAILKDAIGYYEA